MDLLSALPIEISRENELHLAKAHATRLDTEWQKKVETAVANSKAEIDELKRGHREEMEQTSRNFETEIAVRSTN